MNDLALCTVVTKSHLGYARALAASYRRQYPDSSVYVLLADRAEDHVVPEREPFELVELAALGIPDLPRLCFQYNAFELSCALKAYLMLHLLSQRKTSRLVYLDSDMAVMRELTEVRELLETHSILLTPHLIRDVDDDGRKPGERHILESGIYNAGFMAVRDDASARRFLQWLSQRVYTKCVADTSLGLFVDQRWLDFAPGMFDGVGVLRHPGYNVGHWALNHRTIEACGDNILVDGLPLALFHFSGLNLDELTAISAHQDRLTLADVRQLRPLFEEYRSRVLEAGQYETRDWPYAFGRFRNGVAIPQEARRMYWELGDGVERFGNPFETSHPGSFWEWLNEDVHAGTGISRLWYRAYKKRLDVQRAFPDVLAGDRDGFLLWARQSGKHELGIDERFGPAPARAESAAVASAPVDAPAMPSVNIAGHATSEKGMGESMRATVRALVAAGIPHGVIDFPDYTSSNTDRTLSDFIHHNPNPVNLMHLNSDGMPSFVATHGQKFLQGRYNIGFWVWELDELPRSMHHSFAYLDEVWVPSNFCLEAVANASPVPVVKIPHSLPDGKPVTKGVGRSYFGLSDGPPTFLFMFDVHSVLARKNPLAVIRAFKRAFTHGEDVQLVLKLVHGDAGLRRQLTEAAADARVMLIDRVLDRAEVHSLIEVSDCYVSLHRSEGFGLTMAEAMAHGKPVIATGYSGNMDFTTPQNSLLVDYELVELETDHGPYLRGNRWADPDVDHAARLMRLVYEHPGRAKEIGARAASDIRRYLSCEAVGARISKRLEILAPRLPGGPVEPRGRSRPTRRFHSFAFRARSRFGRLLARA